MHPRGAQHASKRPTSFVCITCHYRAALRSQSRNVHNGGRDEASPKRVQMQRNRRSWDIGPSYLKTLAEHSLPSKASFVGKRAFSLSSRGYGNPSTDPPKMATSSQGAQISPPSTSPKAVNPSKASSQRPRPQRIKKPKDGNPGRKDSLGSNNSAPKTTVGVEPKQTSDQKQAPSDLSAFISDLRLRLDEVEKKKSAHNKKGSSTQSKTQGKVRYLNGVAKKTNQQGSPRPNRVMGKHKTTTVSARGMTLTSIETEQPPTPQLQHNLDRVLFNPGVYHLQDPRSRVYNFDPHLQEITPAAEFDFQALKEYRTSSRDPVLEKMAKQEGKRYFGSTSSMTSVLAHFHFLISQWRPINTSMLSKSFPEKYSSFTELTRSPSAVFLRWKNGTYAIDADKQFESSNILSMLGRSMEKFLTLKKEDFDKYRKSNPEPVPAEEASAPESFHYSTLGNILMRSQLDAYDSRVPGTGMFDLKTRAVASIRVDVQNYEHGLGYQIQDRLGEWESYEREYFDMIRAAFLKYSLQVRMGRMDGIFVAFHNVEQIFGFQYISLPEMDATLHGTSDTLLGDQEFGLSIHLMNVIMDKATAKFPDTTLRLHFETRETSSPFLYIFAEPVTEEQADEIQSANAAEREAFDRRVLGIVRGETPSADAPGPQWDELEASVQRRMDLDEQLDDTEEEMEGGVARSEETIAASKEDEQEEEDQDEDEEDEAVGNEEANESEEDEETDADMEESEASNSSASSDVQAEGLQVGDTDSSSLEMGKGASGEPTSTGTSQDDTSLADENTIDSTASTIDDEKISDTMRTESEPSTPESASNSGSPVPGQYKTDSASGPRSPTAADPEFLDKLKKESEESEAGGPILAMTLTLVNKLNGQSILRPDRLNPADNWSLEYRIEEVESQSRAWKLYESCQLRRKKKLTRNGMDGEGAEGPKEPSEYVRRLRALSKKGRQQRVEMLEKDGRVPREIV